MEMNTRFLSSLTKVFPNKAPEGLYTPLTLLQKDALSFQFAYFLNASYRTEVIYLQGRVKPKQLSLSSKPK